MRLKKQIILGAVTVLMVVAVGFLSLQSRKRPVSFAPSELPKTMDGKPVTWVPHEIIRKLVQDCDADQVESVTLEGGGITGIPKGRPIVIRDKQTIGKIITALQRSVTTADRPNSALPGMPIWDTLTITFDDQQPRKPLQFLFFADWYPDTFSPEFQDVLRSLHIPAPLPSEYANEKVRRAVAHLSPGSLKEIEISGFVGTSGHSGSPLIIRNPALQKLLLNVLQISAKSTGEDLLDRTDVLTLRDKTGQEVAFRIQIANGSFDFGAGWPTFIRAVAEDEDRMLKQEVASVPNVKEIVVNRLLKIREPEKIQTILSALTARNVTLFDYLAIPARRYRFDLDGDSRKSLYIVLAVDSEGNPTRNHPHPKLRNLAILLQNAPYEPFLSEPVALEALPPPGVQNDGIIVP